MSTQKLIITRGYPASGKSTAALACIGIVVGKIIDRRG